MGCDCHVARVDRMKNTFQIMIENSKLEVEWVTKTRIHLKRGRHCTYSGVLRSAHATIFAVQQQ